jgi:hypothetical protein
VGATSKLGFGFARSQDFLDNLPMKLFAVISTRGSGWQPDLPLDAQAGWRAHASFMNALVSDGFVLLEAPLESTPDVLLVVRADSEDDIARRLEGDPWTAQGRLRLARVNPWTLRLGSLPGS